MGLIDDVKDPSLAEKPIDEAEEPEGDDDIVDEDYEDDDDDDAEDIDDGETPPVGIPETLL